jgi:hypothetical protein
MAAATMAYLPPPPTTTTATLVLITLALALPRTRIGWRVGGRPVMRLIRSHHGRRHWCHLCLHLRDNGAKDVGHGNRRGRHANTRGQEEVRHHNPIGVEQQKPKQKQNKNKINNIGGNVIASVPADSYVCAASAAASAEAESAAAAARA